MRKVAAETADFIRRKSLVRRTLNHDNTMTCHRHFSEEPKAWDLVKARGRYLLNPDQQHWYQTVGYVLTRLLDNAGYSQQGQVMILRQFANQVAPYLGLAPKPGMLRWESFMTDDHNPIELSWDFHTGAERPTIRYSIEPVTHVSGKPPASNNVRAAKEFKENLLKALPGTETLWFDHFEACFSHSWTEDVPEGHRSTIFWAFDLSEKATTSKAYFFPGAVAHATRRTNLAVISDAIKSAPGFRTREQTAFHVFTKYLEQHPDVRFEVDMLALDLVQVEKARIKIYFRDRRTDFHSVREIMSLGGQIRDPDFEKGLKRLRRLWDDLLGTRGVAENVSLPHKNHRTAGILYNIEFRMNSKTPKVKIYIPARHYAKNDRQVLEALSGFLSEEAGKQRGLEKAKMSANLYSKCLHETL